MLSRIELSRSNEDVSDFSIGKFNDLRLQKTGALLFKRICTMFSTCIKKLAGERKLEVSFGRFLQHNNVTMPEICSVLTDKANSNCLNKKHILAIQDTVEATFPTQGNKKHLFGDTTHESTKGFFGHPSILVDAFTQDILGIGGVKLWTRDNEELIPYKHRTIEDKESFRWIEVAKSIKENITNATLITHITDREGDLYEFFSRIPDEKNHLIVRSNHDRVLLEGDFLSEHMARVPIAEKYKIHLPAITGVRVKRDAKVSIKFSKVDLSIEKLPVGCTKESVEVTCIEIAETGKVGAGIEKIFWRLFTTHEISTVEETKQIAEWYTWRWIIEQIFRTMKKKGFKIEDSQIENPESLMKMFLLGLAAAVQVLCLVYARDGKTKRPASDVFNKEEIVFLRLALKKVEGKTEKQQNPYKKDTLSWAAWIIARLGSWYPGASHPPGPITMYDGFKKFYIMFETWEMLREHSI